MSRYITSLPVRKKEVYSAVLGDLKTQQYAVQSASVCFHDNYTEYTLYGSDDYDHGHGITCGLTVKYSGQQVKCTFFCGGPPHNIYDDPMVDASDFKIDEKYAPYLINLASKKGFNVNLPDGGGMLDNILYFDEAQARQAVTQRKEAQRKWEAEYARRPKKTDYSLLQAGLWIAAIIFAIYLIGTVRW